jgi:hypothetical protein
VSLLRHIGFASLLKETPWCNVGLAYAFEA